MTTILHYVSELHYSYREQNLGIGKDQWIPLEDFFILDDIVNDFLIKRTNKASYFEENE